jgi:hypothetical protein
MDASEDLPPKSHPQTQPEAPEAPDVPYEKNTKQTPYMIMSIRSNQAGIWSKIGAMAFSWLLLAGYLVLPNTFTSLKTSKALGESKGGQILQSTVQNVNLLYFAGVLCFIGLSGTCRLWYKWRRNYVWLITYIFA